MKFKKFLGFSLALSLLFNSSYMCNSAFANEEVADNEIITDDFSLTTLNEASGTAYAVEGGNIYFESGSIIGCDKTVTSAVIPNEIDGITVTKISRDAFSDCSSLTAITIPDSVTYIGNGAFSNCSSLETINIPNGVTALKNSVFSNCSSLKTITIPNSVTSIGSSTFSYCSSLETINIPDSVTSIANSAFSNCSSLAEINVGENNTEYASIGGVLYNKALTSIIFCPVKITSITIPKTVTAIDTSVFSSCSSLAEFNVDENNTEYASIGGVLYNKALTSIIYCPKKITSITLPNTLTTIGDGAFSGCSSLTSITIPDSVTSISNSAFYGCSSLDEINVGENNTEYTSISGVLYNKALTSIIFCPKKITSITLPNTLTSIGDSTFSGCSSLTSITIPNSVTSIGDYAFHSCSALTSITIPNSVTSIGNNAFVSCTGLTSIIIPDSVTSIGESAFLNCSGLTSITLSKSLTSISSGAFAMCSSLKAITIPNSVTSIGDTAFWKCSSLETVTIPDSVTSISDYAFEDCSSLAEINVDENNTDYASISGVLYNKALTSIIFCPKKITSITIPETVTAIDSSAFRGCSSLETITIPNSITSIGMSAFYNCKALTDVYYLGSNADWNKISIDTFNDALLKANLHCIQDISLDSGDKIHLDNSTIKEYIITGNKTIIPTEYNGTSINTIDDNAFSFEGSVSIVIPDEITTISALAFDLCDTSKVVIYAQKGSSAEQYAKNNSIKLEYINLNFDNESAKKGDADGDGELTKADSEIYLAMALDNDYLNSVIDIMGDSYKAFLDLDNDGAITATDSAIALKSNK